MVIIFYIQTSNFSFFTWNCVWDCYTPQTALFFCMAKNTTASPAKAGFHFVPVRILKLFLYDKPG